MPIAPTFNAAERRLAREMKDAWAAFAKRGAAPWPRHRPGGPFLVLQAGGRSHPITDREYAAAHQCEFWS